MTATIGHNSVAGDQLKAVIERIERMDEEKKAIADDIKDIFAEAKSNGFDVKVIRAIVRERKQDKAALAEFESLKDIYRNAIGDLLE